MFDKHSGSLIGFTDLGDIRNHLSRFDNSLEEDGPTQPQLANTVLVFMVRGIFSKLMYVCLVCNTVHYSLVIFVAKVMGVTMDGASPSRKLMRLHKEHLMQLALFTRFITLFLKTSITSISYQIHPIW